MHVRRDCSALLAISAGIDSADALKSTVEASVVLEGCLDFSCVNYHDSRAWHMQGLSIPPSQGMWWRAVPCAGFLFIFQTCLELHHRNAHWLLGGEFRRRLSSSWGTLCLGWEEFEVWLCSQGIIYWSKWRVWKWRAAVEMRSSCPLCYFLPADSVIWWSDASVVLWSVVWCRCSGDTEREENACAGCQVLLIPTRWSCILFQSGGINSWLEGNWVARSGIPRTVPQLHRGKAAFHSNQVSDHSKLS